MKFRSMLIVALLSLLSGPAAFASEPVAAGAARFPLMAWDYADDQATFEAMRDAGITSVAFVPIKALDLCHDASLQAVVFDERLSGATYHGPFDGAAVEQNLPAVLKEVGDHPAVLGYHLRDEPSPEQYPDLAKGVAAVRKLAPGKWPYINLLPGEGEAYDKYVEDFVTICNPTVLSYDRYTTYGVNDFLPIFWANLAQMREAAQKHKLDFWNVVLTATHWNYRELTEADYRMEVFGSLVYGAKGIGYYKFMSGSLPILKAPDLGNFRNAPLDQFGERTPAWHWMRNINRQVHNMAPVLLKLESNDVYHIGGTVPDRNHGPSETSLVKSIPEGEFVVGDFTHSENSKRYVMIVNRSMVNSQRCAPEFLSTAGNVKYVSPITGETLPYIGWAYFLAPGQGVLLELNPDEPVAAP
ncbi:hypothetical protein [Lacipirellula sp.]|uniref:hypothetical protein n=1 Tax=Lacipirellula sp. TaxID=2691419 RepID=UPI003D142E51